MWRLSIVADAADKSPEDAIAVSVVESVGCLGYMRTSVSQAPQDISLTSEKRREIAEDAARAGGGRYKTVVRSLDGIVTLRGLTTCHSVCYAANLFFPTHRAILVWWAPLDRILEPRIRSSGVCFAKVANV